MRRGPQLLLRKERKGPRHTYRCKRGGGQKARRAMVDGGMVVLSYDVYRDFMAYARGLYVPESLDSGSKSGRHAVSCFGYGQHF